MFGRRVDYTAPQAARVAFGAVLLVGAVLIVDRASFHGLIGRSEHSQLAGLFGWTWLAALVAGAIAYAVASYLPPAGRRERLLHLSFVVPAAGLALMLPLSLHLLYCLALDRNLAGFDEWVGLSIVLVGFAHVAFAATMALRASQLARGKPAITIGAVYFSSVAAASIPFPVVPSLFVAITGLPILPLLWAMQPLAARERATADPLPRAIVRSA